MPNCNFHPPFPRPEPFSPLPRPGQVPDWGKWIRDRLSEKGALLTFPSASAFPDPGAQPNVYEALDTGILYRWDGAHYQVLVDPAAANDVLEYEDRDHFPETGEHGKLYIAADTGSLYRWGGEGYAELSGGKADKAVPVAEGNLAALTQDGNLVDSLKKPSDFATAAQGAKADTAVQPAAVTGFVDGAEYDAAYGNPPKPTILLKHGDMVVATVDATAFIKDGMVSSAAVAGGKLVITFNTDSGKQPIEIPLTDIFDPDAYYDKGAVDAKLAPKADKTITVVPAHGLPADCYPVVYVKDGTTHTIAGDADIRENGPRYYTLYDSDAMVCYFTKSTGKYFIGADITSITFNGTAPVQNTWPVLTSAAVTSDVVYDKDIIAPSTAPAASGKAADAKATGDALAGKASKADATLTPIYSGTPTFSEWTYTGIPDGWHVTSIEYNEDEFSADWYIQLRNDSEGQEDYSHEAGSENDTRIVFQSFNEISGPVIATRTRTDIIGYTLGSQSDKPLQPKGDYAPATNIPKSALAQDVQTSLGKADAALSRAEAEKGFTEWEITPPSWDIYKFGVTYDYSNGNYYLYDVISGEQLTSAYEGEFPSDVATSLSFGWNGDITATRVRLPTMADVNAKANRAANPTAGNLAALDAQGNPTDSGIAKTAVAPLASPVFTGTPTAPTPTAQSGDTQVATKKYVDDAVAGATPNLDYVMRVDPETGGIYYTTPDTNA